MTVKITVAMPAGEERPIQASVSLRAKKTLDGKLLILDHDDIDIVISPSDNKIITFTKGNFSDLAYDTQNRLFQFLQRNGVILPGTVRAGNVHGSLEAEYPPTSEYADPLQTSIYVISNFLEMERPYLDAARETDKMDQDRILDPDETDSTELGEVPHEETKGTMRPGYPGYYYGLAGVYRF